MSEAYLSEAVITYVFQRLDDRRAGRPADDTLHDGVPAWLESPLREWLRRALGKDDSLARRVVVRLRMTPRTRATYGATLIGVEAKDLLVVVDATLQLHPGWDWPDAYRGMGEWGTSERMLKILGELEDLLIDGGSLYTITGPSRHLVERVDPTAAEAFKLTVTAADQTAGDHLQAAWIAAYGLAPDPDKVFNESIRAVEQVTCPLVQQQHAANGKATLGSAIGELKNAGHRWELVLPGEDGQPRGVTELIGMLQMLWQAQVSRHAGAPKSRRQSEAEAEAAVHLAVTIVQWLSAGVLRHKP